MCAAVLLAAVVPAAPARAEGFRAGTGRVVTTPPLLGKAAAPDQFSICPPTFDGPRAFAFDEPYTDTNGDGRFDYPEPYCDANANGRYDGIYSAGGGDMR